MTFEAMQAANEMPRGNPTNLAIAWSEASDHDVVKALRNPEGFAPAALQFIELEALRRNLDSNTHFGRRGVDGPLVHAALRRLGGWLSNRYVIAGLVGTLFPLGRMLNSWSSLNIPTRMEFIVLGVLYVVGLAIAAWPLIQYQRAARLALAGSAGFTIVGTFNAAFRAPGVWDAPAWFFVLGTITVFAVTWGFGCGVLSGLTYLRKRFWPVYASGHCAACGYDLFGLKDARCPECGTPFRRDSMVAET